MLEGLCQLPPQQPQSGKPWEQLSVSREELWAQLPLGQEPGQIQQQQEMAQDQLVPEQAQIQLGQSPRDRVRQGRSSPHDETSVDKGGTRQG